MSDHAMPGTAQGIKEELLRAIDQSGKVSIFFSGKGLSLVSGGPSGLLFVITRPPFCLLPCLSLSGVRYEASSECIGGFGEGTHHSRGFNGKKSKREIRIMLVC